LFSTNNIFHPIFIKLDVEDVQFWKGKASKNSKSLSFGSKSSKNYWESSATYYGSKSSKSYGSKSSKNYWESSATYYGSKSSKSYGSKSSKYSNGEYGVPVDSAGSGVIILNDDMAETAQNVPVQISPFDNDENIPSGEYDM
jgi:hypothetical protein